MSGQPARSRQPAPTPLAHWHRCSMGWLVSRASASSRRRRPTFLASSYCSCTTSANCAWPFRNRATFSSANAENVVNPPQNPVMPSSRQSSGPVLGAPALYQTQQQTRQQAAGHVHRPRAQGPGLPTPSLEVLLRLVAANGAQRPAAANQKPGKNVHAVNLQLLAPSGNFEY